MTTGGLPDDFELLRTERRALASMNQLHRTSVEWFRNPDRYWFRVQADEEVGPKAAQLRHLTSTASAIESLADEPSIDWGRDKTFRSLVDGFSALALDAGDDRWHSENGARVYCRVRTLAPILKFASDDVLERKAERIMELMRYGWDRVVIDDPSWSGVSEVPDPPSDQAVRKGYPPNAFHTYWAVRCLEEFSNRELGQINRNLRNKRAVAQLWAERTLGMQTALITAGAEPIDANQLAWALATQFIHPPDPPLTRESAHIELYRAALAAFFGQQLPSGGWGLYRPIFHYPEAGNAYCYTFETLCEMLRPALHKSHGRVLRDLLRPYLPNLLLAWHYAEETRIDIDKGVVGWCSGHHPHRVAAEGWATASVFGFLQILRRLVAFWTHEASAVSLGVKRPRWATKELAAAALRQRGTTWTNDGEWTVARRLSSMFVHPVTASADEPSFLDPDRPLVDEDQARSAILFGPPGTSKSTVVEALAGAIGWQFLELQASDFLSDGMDRVSGRAESIFARVMELDHCVVFFDEIDELIRERSIESSDPFGRFLTTSMLPKLAKLWEQRRVLFFVATNDIARADPAIKRSQRFDAVVFAAPPSFQVKDAYLHELGLESPSILNVDSVSRALDSNFEDGDPLGVFALLRYDQIPELVERVASHTPESTAGDAMKSALTEMGRDLHDAEWHRTIETTDGHYEDQDLYEVFRKFAQWRRRDFRMRQLICVESGDPVEAPQWCSEFECKHNSAKYLKITGRIPLDQVVGDDGVWRASFGEWIGCDDGLLTFTREVDT